MSNYLLVVAERSHHATVDRWLAAHAEPGEVRHVTLSGRRRLTIVAPQVNRCVFRSRFFRGVAVTTQSLIFGARGWKAASHHERAHASDHSGSFVAVQWDRRAVTVDRDVYGNVRLLTTAATGLVAASDSLLVLSSLRAALGLSLTLDEEVLHGRSLLNLVGSQQLSHDTHWHEVRFIPAGFGVTIAQGEVTTQGTSMAARVTGGADYRDAVREAAASIARTTSAASAVPGWTAELSLSGGYDSRVIYAAGRLTGAEIVSTSRRSSSVHDADYAVARDITSEFGTPFGRREPVQAGGPAQDWLTVWGAAHLGVYDGFGTTRTRRWHPKTININGMGAETAKGNWDFVRWHDLVSEMVDPHDMHVTPAGAAAFTELGRRGIVSVGGDPDSPVASELLYLGFRSGLHAAAGQISINMTSVMPLQDMKLTRLGYTPRDHRRHGDASIIADLSILLDPHVAAFRYDLAERNLSRAFVDDRLAALGGPLGRIGDIRTLGDADDVTDGPTTLSLSIARGTGLVGACSVDEIFARCEDDIDLLPTQQLKDTYRLIAKNGRWMIGKREGDVLSAGVSPPKTASLALLRLLP